jgi:hypothetical protein
MYIQCPLADILINDMRQGIGEVSIEVWGDNLI